MIYVVIGVGILILSGLFAVFYKIISYIIDENDCE
jgi:hypothetical protein